MSQITLEKIKQIDPNCRVEQNIVSLYNSTVNLLTTSSFSLPMILSLTNNTISLTSEFYLIFNYMIGPTTAGLRILPSGLTTNIFTSFGFQQSSYPNLQINATSTQGINQMVNINKAMNSNYGNIARTGMFDDDLFFTNQCPSIGGGVNFDGPYGGLVIPPIGANYSPQHYTQNVGRIIPAGFMGYMSWGVQLKHLIPSIYPTFKYGYGLCQFNISCAVNVDNVLSVGTLANFGALNLTRIDLIYSSIKMSVPPPMDFFSAPVKKSINIILGQLPGPYPMTINAAGSSIGHISSNQLQLTSQRLRMIYLIPFIQTVNPNNMTLSTPAPFSDDGAANQVLLAPYTAQYSNVLSMPPCFYYTNVGAIVGGNQVFWTNNQIRYEANNFFNNWLNYYFTIVAHDDRTSDGGDSNHCVMDYTSWLYNQFLAINVSTATGNYTNSIQIRLDVNSQSVSTVGGTIGIAVNYILVSIVEITNSL